LKRALTHIEKRLKNTPDEDDRPQYFHNRKGFGLPGELVIPRVLSKEISTPPYFYFVNVASKPKDEWTNIQRHLYNITPKFNCRCFELLALQAITLQACRRPCKPAHNCPAGDLEVIFIIFYLKGEPICSCNCQ
jgi:hypothetical protein